MADLQAAIAKATQAVESANGNLLALSREIHGYPELKFEEFAAHTAVVELLTRRGFAVTSPVAGLDTAFVARFGNGSMSVGICVEYDALPDVGHACGHNLIAASSVGAAIGLAAVAEELDLEVVVLGTPAEEGGGGKIVMARSGAFDGVDAAMMVHPADARSPCSRPAASTACTPR